MQFSKIISGLLIYVLTVTQVFAQTATLLPNAKQTFLGTTGTPLASGTVTLYVPNSTNKKTSWLDPYQTSANTNPIQLDAAGRAVIFGQGNYRQIVKDKNGNTIWDSFTSAVGSSSPSGATGTDTAPVGTILPYAGFSLPTNWQLAYGQAVLRATFTDLLAAVTIKDTAVSCISSSTTLSGFASTAQFRVGAPIEATCISTGVTIASIVNGTSITVSSAASATGTVTATVFPWGNGDGVLTFNVPDLRGRVIPGADAMGGSAASRLTSTYYGADASAPAVSGGSQSKTLVQSNLPNVTLTTTSTSTVTDVLRNPSGFQTATGLGTGAGIGTGNIGGFTISSTGTTSSINGGVTETAFATIQPSLTINYMIKMAPNSTGAGGVVSIGGMFGDIVCDTTFNCSPQGSPSANTIGLASQSNLTMLANITGGSAQPTGTTNSAWLDATCGTTDGMIPMRNSTWGCLTPGTAGYALISQGPGQPLHWLATGGIGTVSSVGLALPNIFSVSGSPITGAGTLTGTLATQSANTVFAGATSGGAATPTFRSLVSADIPVLPNANLQNPLTTVNGANCTLGSNCTVVGLPLTVGGRITTVSGMPYVNTSQTGVYQLFYSPIPGVSPYVPLYNGTVTVPTQFTASPTATVGLSLLFDATNYGIDVAYDLFVGLDSGTIRLGTGPNWGSLSGTVNGSCGATSSGGRGTGAGTTELALVNGFCTNANSMTVRYNNGGGSNTFTCAQYRCFYAGTVYMPNGITTLRSAISSTGATSISPTDSCGTGNSCFPTSAVGSPLIFYIKIDNEIMKVTGGNECTETPGVGCITYAGTWTVQRAQLGTSAATHLINAQITMAPGQTQCSLQPAIGVPSAFGGDNSECAVYNAYNKNPVIVSSRDNVIQWTVDGSVLGYNTWLKCNQSAANRIAWFDGLGTMNVEVLNYASILGFGDSGVGIDSTTSPTGLFSLNSLSTRAASTPALIADGSGVANQSGNQTLQLPPSIASLQQIGRHYAQCLEYIDTTTVSNHNLISSGQGYQMIKATIQN